MTRVSDYLSRIDRTTVEDWDTEIDLLLERDGLRTIGIRFNPCGFLPLPLFVVRRYIRGRLDELTTHSFPKAFSAYKAAK